ncbi:hypothetical protein [Mesobacillus foraminis]|uniref:hypothetical protein n=1 Tax=Mesobacillus foraminis TaxID=279826 RepID=UPI0013CEEF3F|nr:hypothetical protein [Mesobacillus foraminis]
MLSRKRAEKRRKKKQEGTYNFWDLLFEVIFWIPELILLPFRLLFWLVRFLGRSIFDGL